MIAKGNSHGDGVKLAAYLMKGTSRNERAELVSMRGFAATDLRDGLRDVQIMTRDGTRADAGLFHVQFRSVDGEGVNKINRAQWAEIANRCDQALGRGMDHQARADVLHINRKTGDTHMHLAYSLVCENAGQLHVIKLGLYKLRLQELAREIEKDYGLKIISNERRPGARPANRREHEESRRLGTDINEIRNAVLNSFEKSDNGKSFAAAIRAQGGIVAAGDRRDCFVVVDHAGGQHALNKKLTGKTLAEIRDRLSDIDRSQLPSVDQAKEMQAERQATREAQERGKHGGRADAPGQTTTHPHGPQHAPQPEIKPLGKTAGEIRLAWKLTATAGQFAQEIEHRGLILVHVSREEAEASHRAHAFAKAIDRQNRELKEGFAVVDQRGNVTRIDQRTTGDQWEEIQKRLGGIDRSELVSVAEAREIMREANRAEWREQQQAKRDIEAEHKAAFRAELGAAFARQRAENTEARVASSEARDADREIRSAAATVQHQKQEIIATAEEAVDKGARVLGGIFTALAKPLEAITGFLADLVAPTAPPTRQEAEGMQRTAEEQRAQAAADRDAAETKAAVDWRLFEQNRQQQYDDLMHGRIAPSTPREIERDGDERERGRERER